MAAPQIFIKCRFCTCMSGPFKKLSEEELERVDENRTEISYKKGEILCKQGAFIPNTIFIKKGLVKVYLEGADNPTILSIEREGYFIGIQSIFGKGVYHYTVEALTDVYVCQVDINVYRDLIHTNAEFGAKILEKANEDIISAYNRITSLTQKQIHGRFAELLLNLRDHIYGRNPFKLTVTRKDLADAIHTSPESISRLMKEFREDKIIRNDGHELEILDPDRLMQISQFG